MAADASQLKWKQQISSLNQQIHNTQKSITTHKSWVSAVFSVISLLCLVSRSWAGSNNDTSLLALLFVQIQPEREQDIDKRTQGGKIWLERNFQNNEARRFHASWDCFKSTCSLLPSACSLHHPSLTAMSDRTACTRGSRCGITVSSKIFSMDFWHMVCGFRTDRQNEADTS